MKEGIRMNQKREIRTVSLIGLGAIGCFLASHLGPLMGDNLRVIAGGSRRERLEQEGVMVNGVRHHFNIVSPEETCSFASSCLLLPSCSIVLLFFLFLNIILGLF